MLLKIEVVLQNRVSKQILTWDQRCITKRQDIE